MLIFARKEKLDGKKQGAYNKINENDRVSANEEKGMTAEEKELYHRMLELSHRSQQRGIYTESLFLTEGEQESLSFLSFPTPPRFEGGYEDGERRLAVFGDEGEIGYPWPSVISLLKIAPKMQKYADSLTHRDFLGAMMNLGIKRELLGDIVLAGNEGFVFVLEHIAPYIRENLKRVRHTDVCVEIAESLPENAGKNLEEKQVVAASSRLDALIAAVWNLSRAEAKDLVEKEKVTVRGRLMTDPAKEITEGDRISVRGFGRFIFSGKTGETKSGRSRVNIKLYV